MADAVSGLFQRTSWSAIQWVNVVPARQYNGRTSSIRVGDMSSADGILPVLCSWWGRESSIPRRKHVDMVMNVVRQTILSGLLVSMKGQTRGDVEEKI